VGRAFGGVELRAPLLEAGFGLAARLLRSASGRGASAQFALAAASRATPFVLAGGGAWSAPAPFELLVA
jgi:hypothetical protein